MSTTSTRVLVVDPGGILGGLLDYDLKRTPGLELIAAESTDDLPEAMIRTDADCVLLEVDGDELPEGARRMFADRAWPKVLAVRGLAGETWLYEPRPDGRMLGPLSTAEIAQALLDMGRA